MWRSRSCLAPADRITRTCSHIVDIVDITVDIVDIRVDIVGTTVDIVDVTVDIHLRVQDGAAPLVPGLLHLLWLGRPVGHHYRPVEQLPGPGLAQ